MKVTYSTKEKQIINAGYCYAARVSYRVNGKTKRRYCNTKKEASEFVERLRADQDKFGSLAKTLTEKELTDAARIIDICKVKNWNPFEVLDFYEANAKKISASNQLSDVVEAICRQKETSGKSEGYIKQFQMTARDFANHINGKLIDSVSKNNVLTYLNRESKGWGPKTKNYKRSLICNLFEMAKLHELANHNPVSEIPRWDEPSRTIGYFDPKSIDSIMGLVARIDPQMAVIYTLVFFCGLRLAEAARMSWDWVSLEHATLRVPSEIAKTCKRVIDIPDNALEWLTVLKKEVRAIELSERKKELADMTAAEIKLWKDTGKTELHNRQKTTIRKCRLHGVKYSKNAVRHSYGTFHLALYGDIGKTATNMGNSPNQIHNHYNGECMDKKAAARFFSIRPE
jgi:integrase